VRPYLEKTLNNNNNKKRGDCRVAQGEGPEFKIHTTTTTKKFFFVIIAEINC
jgi:hypothetical protein